MARESGPASGFRDMHAKQMLPRERMLGTIERVYQAYGFTPLDTPAVELTSTLNGKAGAESDSLTYGVKGRGDKTGTTRLSLRFDLTVPLARYIGQNPDLDMPFKRYQVGKVWRGDRPQAGRYREFTQFDADTVGAQGALPDAEVVAMMSDSMEALGADALVRVNNRRLLDALAHNAGIENPEGKATLLSAIDNVEKIGVPDVLWRIEDRLGTHAAAVTNKFLTVEGSSAQRLTQLDKLLKGADGAEEGVHDLARVFNLLESAGYGSQQVTLDQSIARGLGYYTGIIFETRLKGAPQIGSVCSGGRYDNLIQTLGGPNLPAVGTSIGVDRLMTGLDMLGNETVRKTPAEVLIVNFNPEGETNYMALASSLRAQGIPTEVFPQAKGLKDQLQRASHMEIPYTVLAGPQELAAGVVTIQNMKTRERIQVPADHVAAKIAELKAQG